MLPRRTLTFDFLQRAGILQGCRHPRGHKAEALHIDGHQGLDGQGSPVIYKGSQDPDQVLRLASPRQGKDELGDGVIREALGHGARARQLGHVLERQHGLLQCHTCQPAQQNMSMCCCMVIPIVTGREVYEPVNV